jgi:hypothetical protein
MLGHLMWPFFLLPPYTIFAEFDGEYSPPH